MTGRMPFRCRCFTCESIDIGTHSMFFLEQRCKEISRRISAENELLLIASFF